MAANGKFWPSVIASRDGRGPQLLDHAHFDLKGGFQTFAVVNSNGGHAHGLLKNSVFGQLSAFQQNTVPRAPHFENVVYQTPIHKTPVQNRGSVFPARGFFQQNSQITTFAKSNLLAIQRGVNGPKPSSSGSSNAAAQLPRTDHSCSVYHPKSL